MSMRNWMVLALSWVALLVVPSTHADSPKLGVAVSDADVAAMDISVDPTGRTLPPGSGDVETGMAVYAAKCANCHGVAAAGGKGLADPLVGGMGSLGKGAPKKTVGSFWPYATTLFDYVRRAMPLDKPMSLTNDEVYAVSAYILSLNGIVPKDATLDAKTLPAVKMPNRDGFVSQWK